MDMLKALKSSLKHRREHVLRPLQLYGDQALIAKPQSNDQTLLDVIYEFQRFIMVGKHDEAETFISFECF